jgi:hypothetical protein
MEKVNKKKNWLGSFWKSCIFVPPTPGSELKKQMQEVEEATRAGGRQAWPIKIIETAGKTLEQTLVNTDPFNGNKCTDKNCLPTQNPKNKINCRRNCICYKITCLICLKDGRSGELATNYFGESGKNIHCRSKEHVSKFNSKTEKIRVESAFIKHLESKHQGRASNKSFSDYFKIEVLKAYRKPFTKCVEEGTYIANHQGEILNSKSEWHQAKIIRTTTKVVQGGAEVGREQGAGGQGAGQRTGQGAGQGAGQEAGQGAGERRQSQRQREMQDRAQGH